jgi:hypothetical protein
MTKKKVVRPTSCKQEEVSHFDKKNGSKRKLTRAEYAKALKEASKFIDEFLEKYPIEDHARALDALSKAAGEG